MGYLSVVFIHNLLCRLTNAIRSDLEYRAVAVNVGDSVPAAVLGRAVENATRVADQTGSGTGSPTIGKS